MAAVPAPASGLRSRALRGVVALALVVLALTCVTAWSVAYRSAEAAAAATAVRAVDDASFASGDAFHVEGAGDDGRWFVVTPACTTVILMVPLVLFAAWSLVQRRLRPAMTLAGLVGGLAVLAVLGTLRLTTIGLAWRSWGDSSLWITHTLVGTLISLGATLLALGLQATVTGLGSPAAVRAYGEG